MKKLFLLFLTTLVIFVNTSFTEPPASKHFTIKQLSPGVWAAINNDNYGHAICNAGIIDLGDQTIIFDPFMNLDAAKDLKAVAKQLTKREASTIINSHYHNDHIRGNQAFLPARIISTQWTRNKIAISEPEEVEWEKKNVAKLAADHKKQLVTANVKEKEELTLWIGYYEGIAANLPLYKIILPNVTFTDSLWIHGIARSLQLVELKDGHTASDLILVLPKEGIVFMGDLLFEKRHPYLAHGKPGSWSKHLQNLYENTTLQKYVPGHGEVCDRAYLKTMNQYILDLQSMVSKNVDEQKPDSLTTRLPAPIAYADWKFGRFLRPNLNFLIKEYRKNK